MNSIEQVNDIMTNSTREKICTVVEKRKLLILCGTMYQSSGNNDSRLGALPRRL